MSKAFNEWCADFTDARPQDRFCRAHLRIAYDAGFAEAVAGMVGHSERPGDKPILLGPPVYARR